MAKFKTLTFPPEHKHENMGAVQEFNDQKHFDDWIKEHPFLKDAEEQGNKLVFTKEDDSEGYAIIS